LRLNVGLSLSVIINLEKEWKKIICFREGHFLRRR